MSLFPTQSAGQRTGSGKVMQRGFQLGGRVGILSLMLEQILAAGDESQHLPLLLPEDSRVPAVQRDLPQRFVQAIPWEQAVRSTGK